MTTILELPLDQIDRGTDRARELDPGHAQGMADSIRMQGLICPVVVRRIGSGYRLVAGLHRFEAFRILGREMIAAILSDKESDDEARLDEVMENLARRITAFDFCKHVFKLKEAWLRLHPEVKHGGDRGNQHTGGKSQKLAFGNEEPEITAFDGAMAEKFDLSRATIKDAVAIWQGLSDASRVALRSMPLSEKKTELKALSKEKHPRQTAILDLINDPAHPDIQNVVEAIFHLDNGVTPDAAQKRFLTVSRSFGTLDDSIFDNVIAAHEARVIASLKRRGRI